MPGHSDTGAVAGPGAVPAQSAGMSRRRVLRGAAGAAGLAAAVGAGSVTAVGAGSAAAARSASRDVASAAMPAHAEPVVVYLRDAATGELDVFTGTSQVRFRDPAIAARLLRALQ